MKDFYDFFVRELQDIYSAEIQILKALPQMAQAAHSEKLRQAFQSHEEETKEQVKRLEEISRLLKINLQGVVCKAMQGLIQEGQEVLKMPFEADTRDAALISIAQRIEHYEIAVYGCLKTYAQHLEQAEVEDLLEETLSEESAADKKLTSIAEGSLFRAGINKKACSHCEGKE